MPNEPTYYCKHKRIVTCPICDGAEKSYVCSCHDNVDVDGLSCPKDKDAYEGSEEPCHVRPKMDGTLVCNGCDWTGSW